MVATAPILESTHTVRPLKTREIVRDLPNFRDHGMMVDTHLLKLLTSLQKRYGSAFASEAGLRRMIAEDCGHCPGVDTVPTALERLQRQGLLEHRWLLPGGILPDGSPCTHGTRLVMLPVSRHQRRTLHARATGAQNRREGVTHRYVPHAAQSFQKAVASIGKTLEGSGVQSDREAWLQTRRDAQLAALRDFDPTSPPDPKKPPDD